MKRLILLLALSLAMLPALFADHPKNSTGIGIVASSDYGAAGLGGQVGLSLKLKGVPIFWAFRLSANSSVLSVGATGDQYFTDEALLREKGFALDWFLGLGGYANVAVASSPSAALGARLPVGLSWHISKEFELWLDLAPSLGIVLNPVSFPDWSVPAEIGFRAWLR